jgi:hypothetical protein
MDKLASAQRTAGVNLSATAGVATIDSTMDSRLAIFELEL